MTRQAWIGIDVGGTNLRSARVDAEGRPGPLLRAQTPRAGSVEPLLQVILDQVQRLRGEGGELRGLGLAVPATLHRQGRIASAPNLSYLDGIDLGALLSERLGLPVRVCNDADAAAWGEYRCGSGRGLRSFLMVTLGTGVGGSLVLQGRLWRGADGMAGEVGHVNVEPMGRPCGCGSRGCLEQYASATGIVLQARELLAGDEASRLAELEPAELTSAAVAAAAQAGDRLAAACFDEAGRRLGQVAAGVAVNLLNLEGMVVGGAVSASFDLLLPALRGELAGRSFQFQARSFRLLCAQLGDTAGVIGAGLLAREGEGYEF